MKVVTCKLSLMAALRLSTALAFCLLLPSTAVPAQAAGASLSRENLNTGLYDFQATQAISRDEDYGHLLKASASDIGAGAENFIDNMAKRALEFLSSTSLSQDQKTTSFRRLLNDSFDLETIGRFVLGRYWKTSTEQQRKEYLGLFRQMVIDVYAKRLGEYKGQGFETRGYKADNDKDTIVTSFIVPDEGPEVQVEWRVRYKGGRYKIVDVIVEGVSMSLTQRSEFATVIQRGGGDVQVLLAHLKDKR